jgi:ribosomal-protein-alanine N-acetyltransferase
MGEAADAGAIVRFYRDNDDFIARTQNRARPEFLTEPVVLATLTARRVDYEQDRACNLFAFDRVTDELLGAINLTHFVRGYFHACYLGYALAERAEGRGLMFESLSLVLPFAFEKLRLHRVMANHTPDNQRSGGLLRRLGFREEGLAPRYLRIHGEWRDHVLTALDAEDFQKNHAGRVPLP